MNLDSKYKLDFGTGEAQALSRWLIHLIEKKRESAYYVVVQLTLGRIARKIQRKAIGDMPMKLTLTAEQALALQIAIGTNDWPDDDLAPVLHYIQITLPPPTYRDTTPPPEIPWDATLELQVSGGQHLLNGRS
jgi:hypothetical protein